MPVSSGARTAAGRWRIVRAIWSDADDPVVPNTNALATGSIEALQAYLEARGHAARGNYEQALAAIGEEEVDDEVPTESEPEAEPTPEPTPEPEPEVVEEDPTEEAPTEEEPEPPPTG